MGLVGFGARLEVRYVRVSTDVNDKKRNRLQIRKEGNDLERGLILDFLVVECA